MRWKKSKSKSQISAWRTMTQALAADKAGTKTVIPIRISSCLWKDLPISKLQGLPGKWLKNIDDNKAWTVVAKGIEQAIKDNRREIGAQ